MESFFFGNWKIHKFKTYERVQEPHSVSCLEGSFRTFQIKRNEKRPFGFFETETPWQEGWMIRRREGGQEGGREGGRNGGRKEKEGGGGGGGGEGESPLSNL